MRVHDWQAAVLGSGLPCGLQRVALALSHYMDYNTLGNARPTSRTLAEVVHFHPTYVRRLLAKLVSAGWITRVSRGHKGQATMYRGTFPGDHLPAAAPSEPRPKVKTSAESPAKKVGYIPDGMTQDDVDAEFARIQAEHLEKIRRRRG